VPRPMIESHAFIALADASAWRDALAGLNAGPAHLHGYNDALARGRRDEIILYSYRNERGGIVAAPIIRREFQGHADIYSPYGNGGFLSAGNTDGFWTSHRDFMRKQGITCAHVSLNQIDPGLHLVPEQAVEFLKPVFVVDTSADPDIMWRRFGQNSRRHVRNWRAAEYLSVIEDRDALRDAFLDLYPSFADRMNVAPRHRLPDRSLRAILDREENSKLFGVREASGEVGFVRCFLFTPHSAEAFLEASTEAGRRHSRMIYWRAYQWAHETGIPSLNLSGGIEAGDSLEFFKKDLGGDRRALYRARLIYDDDLYAQLCRRAGADPALRPGGYFPPYHAQENGRGEPGEVR
jgi:hypothetical protein